jgi:membrane protease YdiL (CAAX protease family)
MRSLARRHPIGVFLAITYPVTAAIFAIPFLSNAGIGVIDLDLPGAAPFILLTAFALAGAAFVTTALADGRDGVRELRGRVFRFRVSPVWYVAALAALPVTAIASAVVVAGVVPIEALAADPAFLLIAFLGAIVAFALVHWWEEAAWTGFAVERLQPRMGPLRASVVTTWMQAALHLPLVFIAGGVADGRVPPEQVPFYLVALFVLPIPVRTVLTALYNGSGRSVPIAGLYHAGLGVATGSAFLPVLAPGVDPVIVYAGFAVLAAVVLVASRGRLGYRVDQPRTTAPELAAAAA